MDLYRSGRCRGMRELYELRRLGDSDPRAVERLAGDTGQIVRADIQHAKGGVRNPVTALTVEVAGKPDGPSTDTLAEQTRRIEAKSRTEELVVLGTLDGLEVQVDDPLAQACLACNRGDRGVRQAAVGDRANGRVDELPAPLGRRGRAST